MVRTVRKAAVLLPKSVHRGPGARSACVIAFLCVMVKFSKSLTIHAEYQGEEGETQCGLYA